MELLETNNHSVFSLNYHLILVTKYRRKVFDDDISMRCKELFENISKNYNITIDEWNHDEDHVHILFRAHPNSEITKFINASKSASSRIIKREFSSISNKLWKNNFWNQSFFLITSGDASVDTIIGYIKNQGQKERVGNQYVLKKE